MTTKSVNLEAILRVERFRDPRLISATSANGYIYSANKNQTIIKVGKRATNSNREKLKREYTVGKYLSNRLNFVPKVHKYFVSEEGIPMFSMNMVQGETLQDFLQG